MVKVLNKSLYYLDKNIFNKIKNIAKEINAKCNGSNIIQDDIFNVIQNYGRQSDIQVEIMRYPVNDDDFCACTFLRDGVAFIMCNSHLPLSKQIFAAAHELYHLYKYVGGEYEDLAEKGSILKAKDIDEDTTMDEDREANAFAGLILSPSLAIKEQVDIYGLLEKDWPIKNIVRLMDIFALPFKAMVIRLFEEEMIDETKAKSLLYTNPEDVEKIISVTGLARRWQERTDEVAIGSLEELLDYNKTRAFALEERIQEDRIILEKTLNNLSK